MSRARMQIIDALNLPDGHIRVIQGPCRECGKERIFAIKADNLLLVGETSMYIIDFLDSVLKHCQAGCVAGMKPKIIQ
jgi:hypothetical protein